MYYILYTAYCRMYNNTIYNTRLEMSDTMGNE